MKHQITPEMIEIIQSIVDYNWPKESEDYCDMLEMDGINTDCIIDITEYARNDTEHEHHIFTKLAKLFHWLFELEKEG